MPSKLRASPTREQVLGRIKERADQRRAGVLSGGEVLSADPATLEAFIRDPKFSIAAFKGQKLTFRPWNQQLRQPIFLGDGRSVVTTSPQEGFLHQFSELDTLGVDQPETKCVLK